MADTQRTRAQLLSLYADNVVGNISAQDGRDLIVSIMQSEFVNPGDFFAFPEAQFTTTDKSARGAIRYSQYAGSDLLFQDICHLEASTGYWMRADVADSTKNGLLGMAMNSYASDVSTCQMLMWGLVYNSGLSTVLSELIGRPLYLDSGLPGSFSVGETDNSVYIIGCVWNSDDHGGSAIGKFFFNPNWAVKGQ